MPLGMELGLGPGDFVLDGDPVALPSPKGYSPPIFGPYLLRPNGCMDQDVTWYGGRPRPGDFVLHRDPAPPLQKRGGATPLPFSANVYCGQTVGRIKMKLGKEVGFAPGHIVLDGDPDPPFQRGTVLNLRPISVAAKWLHGSRCQLV